MRVLIVHAHSEPNSFNASLTAAAVETLKTAAHDVVVSDLYAMAFDPVSDRRNFSTVANAERLDQQAEERHASANDGYVSALQAEMDKLAWCDTLILQFPIWWLGMPAILKGWIDRTFASGRSYGGGRMFDRGVHRGKRSMLSVTVGGPSEAYSDAGIYPPIDTILLPITRGILGFAGFDVIEPFVVFGPGRMTADERATEIARYRARVASLDTMPARPPLALDEFNGFVRRNG